MKLMHGEGDGATLYLGEQKGAPYIGIDLCGFNGWTSRPAWMLGGWEFFRPTISTGRLFVDAHRSWSMRVLLPARLVSFYRWQIKPSGRRYMREHAHDAPESQRPTA